MMTFKGEVGRIVKAHHAADVRCLGMFQSQGGILT